LPDQPPTTRKRLHYAVVLAIVILIGLPNRLIPQYMPDFMVQYGGDALWALAIFLIFGLLFPRAKTRILAAAALALAWSIEFSELYQADWINAIRATRLGGLILGYTFLWSDLVCYIVGISVGVILEKALLLRNKETQS
jgi:hypothetical protein